MDLVCKTLPSGVKVPILGFTPATNGDVTVLVQAAVNAGYRHVISDISGDQDRGIAMVVNSGVIPRDEFFVSMKVELPDPDDEDFEINEWSKLLRKRMWSIGRDKIDMVILAKNSYADSLAESDSANLLISCWKILIAQYKTGKVRCLSVEDVHRSEIQLVEKMAYVPQIAFTTNFKTVSDFNDYNSSNGRIPGITLPFAMRRWVHNKLGEMHGKALNDIAKGMEKTIEQVVARFMLQKNMLMICSIQQVAETFQIWDFPLTQENLKNVGGLLNGHALIL